MSLTPIHPGHQASQNFDESASDGMPGQILAYEVFYDLRTCTRYVKTLVGARANPVARIAAFSVVAPCEPYYLSDEEYTREKHRLAREGSIAILKHPATDAGDRAESQLIGLMQDTVARGFYGSRILMPATLADCFTREV